MDELRIILEKIFGEYNGTVIVAIFAIVKYLIPYGRKVISDNADREERAIKIATEQLKLTKRQNVIMKALGDLLEKEGYNINIPELTEGDI